MDDVVDIIQLGYGPVGQLSALLLGTSGHTVAVVEKHRGLYGLPRAGHFDHEIMRVFQQAGIAEKIEPRLAKAGPYVFRNQHGEELVRYDWGGVSLSGWWKDYYMYQPDVEDALDERVRALDDVAMWQGWEAVGIDQTEQLVELRIRNRDTSEEKIIRGRYLIATDGGSSFTRPAIGIKTDDLGFRERWLVVDYRLTEPVEFEFDNGQICDPARPLNLFQLGKSHRRFAFMVLPDEDTEVMARRDSAWQLIADHGINPDNAEIVRNTVYVFESTFATTWRKGRVFLAGDSAHVMPPFMGQGMCSGLRDVVNLAWKLDRVLQGASAESILDTYEQERLPHVVEVIRASVEAGRLSVTTDYEVAAARDQAFRDGTAPTPMPFPTLTAGMLSRDGSGDLGRLAGGLAPQGIVEVDGRRGLFDDVVGRGWILLAGDPVLGDISDTTRSVMDAAGIAVVVVREDFRDVDGVYARYFAERGVGAILYRPDFYVFGAASTPVGIERLVDQAVQHLAPLTRSAGAVAR